MLTLLPAAILACSRPATPDTAAPVKVAEAVVKMTNAERARKQLPQLEPSARLMRAAQIHAEQMARAGRLDHYLPGAKYPRAEDRLAAVQYPWNAWAENVAHGQEDADAVMRSWMKSKGHRENILHESVTEMGVGHSAGRDGRIYWVQLFARPSPN